MGGPSGNIVLIGFMGSGKTEVGKRLAAATGRRFVDTDELIASNGTSVQEIFVAEGEKGFRRREREAVRRASGARRSVVATGGGAVLDPANVEALKRSGVLVYLRADARSVLERVKDAPHERPMLAGMGDAAPDEATLRRRIAGLLRERIPVYEGAADLVVNSDGRTPAAIADEIESKLSAPDPAKVSSTKVSVESGSYPVRAGYELLERIGDLVKIPRSVERIIVVSHPRIRRLWGERLEAGLEHRERSVGWWTFPEGERGKTMETAGRLVRFLARSGAHRSDMLVAFGGGVVGDLTGFAASTFARGIAYVHVPTTLLAMVDSSIGGKTGVNLPQGKNLVGTFHQPSAVVADVGTLTTLPDRELRSGMAEVLKYGFIADPRLLTTVQRHRREIDLRGPCLQDIVIRCVRTKGAIVAADERDTGARASLNYGHTLGHALEAWSLAAAKRPGLTHGEAIAIGMVYAAIVARRSSGPDLVEHHASHLAAQGLPTALPDGATWGDVRSAIELDKKHGRAPRMVLLDDLGRPQLRVVTWRTMRDAFNEMGGA